MSPMFPRTCLWFFVAFTAVGCGSDEPECEGAVLETSAEYISFGDLALGGERGVEGDTQVPERRTLFLRNRCGAPLIIESACLINNAHNGDPSDPAFYLEYEPGAETPISIKPGRDGALRVTFDVESTNQDLDDDDVAEQDQAILVLFSNASNNQRLAIPVCGRAVDSDTLEPPAPCSLPSNFDLASVSATACAD
jgi:hypothetical protein